MLWTWRGRWASGGNAACFSTVVSNLALRNRDRLHIPLARIRKMLIKHALIVPPSVKYNIQNARLNSYFFQRSMLQWRCGFEEGKSYPSPGFASPSVSGETPAWLLSNS
jgi:hypothetical protein